MTAELDVATKQYRPVRSESGPRYVQFSREISDVPVFSSRARVEIKSDRRVGSLELHWPEVPEAVVNEARRLQSVVAGGWKPPVRRAATVESVEAGIIHSPPIGFVMDIYPAIRVIYRATESGIGRKPVLYVDATGKDVPLPRVFEKMESSPPEARRVTKRQ